MQQNRPAQKHPHSRKPWQRGGRLRRGIYIVPSLFTTGNLFCGFYALIAAGNQQFSHAAIAIFFAFLFDGLDGLIARYTNTSSIFGLEYDSLADVVSFGIAPGMMLYWWILRPFGRVGWLAAFLFVICGVLRLARFNAQTHLAHSRHFIGLPIPAAAGVVAGIVLVAEHLGQGPPEPPVVLVIVAYILASLMVSNIRYRSLKQLELKRRRPFNLLVIAVLLLLVVAAIPEVMFLGLFIGYALSGPVELLYRRFGHHHAELPTEHNVEHLGHSSDR